MRVDFFCVLETEDVWHAVDALARDRRLGGGVYRVHAFRADAPADWRPEYLMPIPRVLGDDPWGRLYMGKADVFTDRFITLRKALHPDYRSHDAHGFARAYRAFEAVQRRFPRLCFTLRFEADPRGAEAEELHRYAEEFGERPPFNAMA